MNISELIENKFIDWLKAKPLGEIVGSPSNPNGCLITKFLNEHSIFPDGVWYGYIRTKDGEKVIIPSDIDSFIQRLSVAYPKRQDFVTAKQALTYL